ncbi:lipid kinase, YegS/Rv2252/BmrU family [Lactobacillus jensenii 1153]|uniref:diacylglycerol/lipid kinase family protein n=1 Tax=Lactobacillus jensenii TaxID=109790 RepID=UPI0001A42E9D|nr:diacylglycerol kinase family protein [Lactobacillus jensenii]EEQ24014.1 lipid kinase, YegS/Rv2252/BmrU family [Lactobacillus jensenii 269-3]EEQ67588.1 lipid kinase, YegS/Rv2252/BmrU family [Lactobacillus jensenii 1153]
MKNKNPKFSIIVNLKAGSGHAKKIWPIIERESKRKSFVYDCFYTKAIGHAQELAKEIAYKHECDLVLVLGGDGTLHEVINGLLFAKQKNPIPVSYIPTGSGNDFAKSYGISNLPLEALEQIINCKNTKNICVGHYIEQIGGREGYFINNLGIGFDARIVHKTNSSLTKMGLNKLNLGQFSYALKGFSAFLTQNTFELIIGDKHFKRAYISIVNNVPYIGGGIKVSPEMSPFKNGLELFVVEKKNIPSLLKILRLFILGKIDKSPYVHRIKNKKLAIKTKNSQFIHLDGEEFAKAEVNLRIDTQTYPFWQLTN